MSESTSSRVETPDDARRQNPVYVVGHRNPDVDSIASAVGYAELKLRLDPGTEYVPARLGRVNAQTEWVLDRSGAAAPQLLPHVLLRVRDIMRMQFPLAAGSAPVREAGLIMSQDDVDLVPVIDDGGRLIGVVTEQALARRYVRQSRDVSNSTRRRRSARSRASYKATSSWVSPTPTWRVGCGCWPWPASRFPWALPQGTSWWWATDYGHSEPRSR